MFLCVKDIIMGGRDAAPFLTSERKKNYFELLLFLKKRQILHLDSQRRRKSYYTYKGGSNEREREREKS